MSRPDDAAGRSANTDEFEVRRLLAGVGAGEPPTLMERERVANTMWASVDEALGERADPIAEVVGRRSGDRGASADNGRDRPETGRRTTRLLLWAAILLVAVGAAGLLRTVNDRPSSPADSPETDRTTLLVGDTNVSFDVLTDYRLDRASAELVTFTAGSLSTSTHERIQLAQAVMASEGDQPEWLSATAQLDATPAPSLPGSEAWLVYVRTHQGCALGDECVTVAELDDGTPLTLAGGSYSRVQVFKNDDRAPIVVVSDVGTPSAGPALANVELHPRR